MGDTDGDHGGFERTGDVMGDIGGDVVGVLSGDIGSTTIGDCGGGDDGGVGVDGCGGGGDDGGVDAGCCCCCLLCSSTSILNAVPRRTADHLSRLLLLRTTLSLLCSSSMSVSSDVVDVGNILVSSLK